MNTPYKRKNPMADDNKTKRVKKECSYGDKCYRKNPAHFREFSHAHLESILDSHTGGEYKIPPKYSLEREMIKEQLEVIVEKQLYQPKTQQDSLQPEITKDSQEKTNNSTLAEKKPESKEAIVKTSPKLENKIPSKVESGNKMEGKLVDVKKPESTSSSSAQKEKKETPAASSSKEKASDYRPIVPPTRRIESFFKVVAPPGKMAAKHAASAPYHVFYTTITDARETHRQPYSITFQEILDPSLGELKCSLQINFMVEVGWLLAQYYFAGYSNKKLTILYGEDCSDLKTISQKKPHVDAHYITMPTPFGKHHTKMMILCYEDGSLRVVISTANLYIDDWENRTQGLWFSPACPELPPEAMPHDGESPTMFKRSLLKYLHHYHLAALTPYVERVKRCDFSKINVFLVASVPGSHFDLEWGLTRAGSLLRQHCRAPAEQRWPLVAQASSLGSYGKEPKLWLTGDFLHHFTRVKNQPAMITQPPELKLIYPSLENVRQSHDNLLGGGCLPYSAEQHTRQMWLRDFLYQWRATHTSRDKAMPHIKSYLRTSPDNKMAAYYLLTSGNISKAAWGTINKGNGALRIMSYEAGVLFLPSFVINKDFFPLDKSEKDHLVIPYDLPPTKYTSDMSPWVSDYLQ
ncbi:probable tyrosyl-DNA phosphodiesterase [Plutella xylostella]|uniref:probable tyrosyl-DNA phosphodiesterase n=1 Tax=Plutella xylostella TaxID=51655 RepID=UPI002032A085|nr:probable tyrosyl-DNA phosphodiesterase [Plutella xylostella]